MNNNVIFSDDENSVMIDGLEYVVGKAEGTWSCKRCELFREESEYYESSCQFPRDSGIKTKAAKCLSIYRKDNRTIVWMSK